MEAPKGLIPFSNLDLCRPYHNLLRTITLVSSGLIIICIIGSLVGAINWIMVPLILVISTGFFLLLGKDALTLIKTPLGVNMNHPFVDDEPIGKALVYVQFSNKQWREMGKHRVRLVHDELIGGYNLVEDHGDYKTIGHFSNSKKRTQLMKQVIIINQALSLRDVVNGDDDPIDDARERENMDYGLLEREWLDEEELSVDGPLAKFINKE